MVEVYHDGAWLPAPLAVVPDSQPVAPAPVAPRRPAAGAAPELLHTITGDEPWLKRLNLPPELMADMLRWWNESRWGRHRLNATWTHAADAPEGARTKAAALWSEVD